MRKRTPELVRGAHRRAHRFDPGPVTLHPVESAALGPTPVAVHDDGDVARNRFGSDAPLVHA